jgi:hypothetical protein
MAPIHHPRNVVSVTRIANVVVLAFVLGVGNVAVCAGWQSSAQARMECCTQATSCPMPHGDGLSDAPQLNQSDADRCCASSERSDSTQQTSTSLAVVATPPREYITLPPPPAPRVAPRGEWQLISPHPPLHVPTHVLLSVFVV